MRRTSTIFILLALLVTAVNIGLILRKESSRSSTLRDLQALATKSADLADSARARERRVLDSAEQHDAGRDAEFANYVRDLESRHQEQLQVAVRKAAMRARREVADKLGDTSDAVAPDTGSGQPECMVSLTCSETISLMASDSMLRGRLDSAASWAFVHEVACSTTVAVARAQRDSSCVATVAAVAEATPWWKRAQAFAAVAVLAALAGAVVAN